jgi:translation initiation factor IF-3
LEKARSADLDLIEIASQADPPVAKIANFQKFKYEENKKERASKKDSGGELKELWLSPRIAEHDLQVRLNRTLEFLKDGHKVKLTVKFKGREMAHQELGFKVLQEAMALLGGNVGIEREPKFEGRKLSMIVGKSKGGNSPQGEQQQNAETKN